jgi:MOSC domain-containing protein YiiM
MKSLFLHSLQVGQTGRTGWYFRVLDEGDVQAGVQVRLLDRPFPRCSVGLANRLMREPGADVAALTELAACPLLSTAWRTRLARRIEHSGPAAPQEADVPARRSGGESLRG